MNAKFKLGLGDACAKSVGVSAEPDVHCWPTREHQDTYVLLASDGVWEFVSNEEAARILGQALLGGATPKAAIEALTIESRRLWIVNEHNYVDDITAILLPVKPVLTAAATARNDGCTQCFGACPLL